MHDVFLQPATVALRPALFAFMRALRLEDPMSTAAVVPFEQCVDAVSQLLADESLGRVYTISADGQPAGYLVLAFGFSVEFGGRTAFVDELYIAPDFRRQGVAKAALAFAEAEAKSHGVRVLFLEVTQGNTAAENLYAAAGFQDRKYRLMFKQL